VLGVHRVCKGIFYIMIVMHMCCMPIVIAKVSCDYVTILHMLTHVHRDYPNVGLRVFGFVHLGFLQNAHASYVFTNEKNDLLTPDLQYSDLPISDLYTSVLYFKFVHYRFVHFRFVHFRFVHFVRSLRL
jgi:hypothetical protein